jgi:exopolyphosphatase / guanosine-5'-triphosphate,3'-diphosphate pyrophosphatase
MSEPRAVIDIGSNTIRLVIYGGPPRAPAVLYNEKITARLGRGVAENGRLGEKAKGVALAALARYAMLARLKGIADIQTVATAAVRDATDGPEFLDRVRALGLSTRLLSGEEEAITSAMGVAGGFPGAKGIVADLGGGSLEIVHVDGMRCEHGVSLPLGTLRLPQMRATGAAKFGQRVRKMVHASEWQCAPGEALYLVGGAHRALGRYAMLQMKWPLDDPHAFELTAEAAAKLCRSVLRGAPPANVPGLSASRTASLPDAAALLAALLREIHPSRVIFSSWGLREGLVFMTLDKNMQAQDPLLAGVAAFAATMGIDAATAEMVAAWTRGVTPSAHAGDERLRLAGTMLALAEQRVEPNLRVEQAMEWALRKRWIGVDDAGRAMIAACILASAGRQAPSADLARLAPLERLREAQAWGLAIRLCRRFSGVTPQAVANSSLTVEGGKLLLSVTEPFGTLYTEPVARDLLALGERLGLQPQFRAAEVAVPSPA